MTFEVSHRLNATFSASPWDTSLNTAKQPQMAWAWLKQCRGEKRTVCASRFGHDDDECQTLSSPRAVPLTAINDQVSSGPF
ncbi:hypothetical protein NW760_008614 [Fusarium oxysporum]|nr:hypothetical protein NW758_012007 [Fusarium oxysporum]KAJ4226537.1 hypothetical protein NW760_008614 [Fusarium oxysporum]